MTGHGVGLAAVLAQADPHPAFGAYAFEESFTLAVLKVRAVVVR